MRGIEVSDGRERVDDLRNARIVTSRLDRLAVRNRLELTLGRKLEKVNVGLAERAIFVGLRRQRVEPLLDVAVLQRLLQARANFDVLVGDGVNFVELGRIGIAVRQGRRIFERCLGQRRALLAALQEQLGAKPVRRRVGDRIAKLLFGLLVPRAVDIGGRDISGLDLTRILIGVIATRKSCAAQGEPEGRADPLMFIHRR